MKKLIAMVMAVSVFLGSVNLTSFAEEIKNAKEQSEVFQTAEDSPRKAFCVQLNQPKLTAQEKAAEELKHDLKKYNENQQKLIQKYENMTNKEFRVYKIKKAFMKILKVLVGCGIVGIWGGSYYYVANKYYVKGCEAIVNAMQEGLEEGLNHLKVGVVSLLFGIFL